MVTDKLEWHQHMNAVKTIQEEDDDAAALLLLAVSSGWGNSGRGCCGRHAGRDAGRGHGGARGILTGALAGRAVLHMELLRWGRWVSNK